MAQGLIGRRRVRYLKVSCLAGICWISWEGGKDIVLAPGQTLEVRKVRRFVLELLHTGEVRLEERESRRAPSAAGWILRKETR